MSKDFNIYTDLDLSLEINPFNGDISKIVDERSVKRAIRHLILFEKWDVPFNERVHGHAKELLFESPDQIIIRTLSDRISWVIKSFEPRVELHDVVVNISHDETGFDVTILYKVISLHLDDRFTFFLERVR